MLRASGYRVDIGNGWSEAWKGNGEELSEIEKKEVHRKAEWSRDRAEGVGNGRIWWESEQNVTDLDFNNFCFYFELYISYVSPIGPHCNELK